MTIEISLADTNELYALYSVDLMSMAIGPVHHSIELVSAKTSRYCGKMSCNVYFTQVQDARIELMNLKANICDVEANVNH